MKTLFARLYRSIPRPITRMVVGLLNVRFNITVVGVFFSNEGKVLILRHVYRRQHPWGLPAGYLNGGEAPEGAAMREVKEEIGLDVKVTGLLSIRPIRPRHMEVVVVGTVADGQVFTPNFEIFEGAMVAPSTLPADMMPSQAEIVRQAVQARRTSAALITDT